jgi:cobalt-zinc-cadmium efflux system outer membrane protein
MVASDANCQTGGVEYARLLCLLGGSCVLILSGCAKYHPRPLNPPLLEKQYRSRTLSDQALQSFVHANARQATSSWPPQILDLRTLTLIGYFYSPDLEIARSQIAITEAGIRGAGARINPSLGFDSGYNTNPESALIYGVLPTLTIETAGKRGLRILQAERQAEAARVALAEAAWSLRSRIRSAFYDHLLAARRRDLLETGQNIRSEIVEIFDKRLAVGEAARPELDVYRVDLITTQAALRAAVGDVAQTRATLASAVGLPLAVLDGLNIESSTLDLPFPEEELPIQSIQRAGLFHRADIRRTLVDYSVSEAALRLEIARQYPDLQLTPGYTFEEGFARYMLSGSIQSLPIFHRSQGPIAVAEAQRRQAGERFEALQAQAIGQMERAVVLYRAAVTEWREANDRLITVQRDREEAARRALAAGEGDRLALATVRLQSVTAARARLDALTRVQTALRALEDSMQQPLEAAVVDVPEPPIVSPRKGASR